MRPAALVSERRPMTSDFAVTNPVSSFDAGLVATYAEKSPKVLSSGSVTRTRKAPFAGAVSVALIVHVPLPSGQLPVAAHVGAVLVCAVIVGGVALSTSAVVGARKLQPVMVTISPTPTTPPAGTTLSTVGGGLLTTR